MRLNILLILIFLELTFAQSVVINKFFNSGASGGVDDVVELLVIEKNLNMQGMLIKDFSSSMNNDNGGKYLFLDNPLWSKLPSGTLIIIRVSNVTTDTDTSDYVLDVGLKDTTLFKQMAIGTFDLATTELVMIKSAGSDTTGVYGSIHAFGCGSAGTFFNSTPEPKLRSTRGASGGKFAYAKNSTSSLADFNGNDADTSSSLILGQPNNQTNALFINRLRTGETNVEEPINVIKDFVVFENYPNPFNPMTTISFKLFRDLQIELSVYNLLGKKITTLENGRLKAGYYEYKFNASQLPSGVYLYELKTNDNTDMKKMILIK